MASRRQMILILVLALTNITAAGNIADFEDLTLAPESYYNGSDLAGGFVSGTAYFNNNYNVNWASWEGFAYSNITDTVAAGLSAQYNAITGSGQDASENYAVGFVGWLLAPTVTLDTSGVVAGLYVTNDNYAYYSMLNGDLFAKKFGGATGDDPDWFKLTITGKDDADTIVGTVDFYLADYRFVDNSQDYIINTWEYLDLTSLGTVKSLEFTLSSSDTGTWGMNTPAYFALDTIIPQLPPLTIAMQKIENTIITKNELINAIDETLNEEYAATDILNNLLDSPDVDDLLAEDIIIARQKIHSAVQHQIQSKKALRKSINKLQDCLTALNGQALSDDESADSINYKEQLILTDINGDGVIDNFDFAFLSQHWMQTYNINE